MKYLLARKENILILTLCAVFISPLQAGDMSDYDCLIEPHAVISVSTREDGVIETLAVGRGDVVKKGQELAMLESGVEKIAVELARARARMQSTVDAKQAGLNYLEGQLGRINELYSKKAIPFHEKDKAETDVILAKAELREAKENLRLARLEKDRAEQILARRTIRSPVDGVVVEILLEPGESVEDRPIMTVAQVDPLNIEVILPEKEYGLIKIGTRAEVYPLIRGVEMQTASVTVVDRVIDAASNTYGARLELPNADYAIPGGIRCEVNFLTDIAEQQNP